MNHSNSQIIPTLNPVFAKRKQQRKNSEFSFVWDLLDKVYDPELPGLTIWDLGILQNVSFEDDKWLVEITPTYSGCPAVDTIIDDIHSVFKNAGYLNINVNVILAPAWSTEMISPAGKAHLKTICIAAPDNNDDVICPLCDSSNTKVISQFGSTACKALYQCLDCLEHFDYFKNF